MPQLSKEARAACVASLTSKRESLVSTISDVLVRRQFPYEDGFSPDDVDAVHFEYAWDTFNSVAFGVSRSRGYCGRGIFMRSLSPIFPPGITSDFVDQCGEDVDEDHALDVLREAQTTFFFAWFMKCWSVARRTAPEVQGFLSIHDTIWWTELDSGEKRKTDDWGISLC